MSNHVGETLYNLRIAKHISQSDLCRGLCSVSAFSRYELGERVPNRLLLNAFLQRMGASPRYMITMINSAEYLYLSWKKRVFQAARDDDFTAVKKLLDEQIASNTALSSPLQKQFLYLMRAYSFESDGNFPESIRLLQEAIELTLPGYACNASQYLMSVEETLMLIKLSELYIKTDKNDDAVYLLNNVIKYLEEHYEERLLQQTYPKAARLIAPLLINLEHFPECERICHRAIEILRNAGMIADLAEIMDSYLKCVPEGGYAAKCRKWLWTLRCVNQKYGGGFSGRILVYQWEQESYLVEEVLRDYRAANNLSQEEMSFGLFSTETLSRAENGKHALSVDNYHAIRSKLSMDEDYFNPRLNTDDYHILEKMDRVHREVTVDNYDKASELLSEVKQEMQKDGTYSDAYNRNYIEAINVCILLAQKKVWGEQLIAACEKVLGCRYEDIFTESFWNRFLSKDKADMLNLMAITTPKTDPGKSIFIWEHMLDKLEKSRLPLADRRTSAMPVIINLSTIYGITGRYQDCIDMCEKGIQICLETGHCTKLGKLIGNDVETRMILSGEKETYREVFQQVYYLNDMYGIVRSIDYYNKFYMENFDKDIQWY